MVDTFWPAVNPVVSEEAGTRGGTHSGIDLIADIGDPVLSPCSGQIIFMGGDGASGAILVGGQWIKPNGQGITIEIRRSDGSVYEGMINRMGHLSGFVEGLKVGDWVGPGQHVAYAGNTGYSTGPHIHWETRWDRKWVGGYWVNPRDLNPIPFKDSQEEDDMFNAEDRGAMIETRDNARKIVGQNNDLKKSHTKILNNQDRILKGLDALEKRTKQIYDGTFFETETSRGTPGGTLITGKQIIDDIAELRGIVEQNLNLADPKTVADL